MNDPAAGRPAAIKLPADNPFAAESELPYRLPPFAAITDAHFLPAFETGFAEQLAEVETITANPEPATFGNTALALERSGRTLNRVAAVFFNSAGADATEGIRAIETLITPRFADHQDAIYLNQALYTRFVAIPTGTLDAESARLVSEYRRDFVRAGAALDQDARTQLRTLSIRISELSTRFSQETVSDLHESALLIDDAGELEGLSADELAGAAAAAAAAGHQGRYLLGLVLPTNQPALSVLANRETRRRLFEASVGRGTQRAGHSVSTLETAAELARLRADRAALLGFKSHADYIADAQTAPSLAAIHEMLDRLVPAAVANAQAEADALAEAAGRSLDPWDWSFYSERVRAQRYDVDMAALRPHFELDRVLRDGVFHAAHRLYGVTMAERTDLVGYHPDVRIWEVHNADGTALGLFLGDYFTRDTKRGGAWMNPLVEQSALLGTRAVVVNNLNLPQPAPGQPALLTFDQVVTCFHEFGHALHGLFSDVAYPKFSGTSVPRDFVEYPSQVNEMWILAPEILTNYARHYQTGDPLPQETIDKVQAARIWGEGFATTEYLGAALLDLAWHELAPGTEVPDPLAFEQAALDAAGLLLDLVPPRYRTGYFSHIFAGGYAAGYYSYIWSEVLDADTVEWFKDNGGLARANGEHFRTELLSRGNGREPLESFRAFRGSDADITPLLVRRGLDQP